MKHFPHQSIDGSWHAVYRVPGTDALHSVGQGSTQLQAAEICQDLNKVHDREAKEAKEARKLKVSNVLYQMGSRL